MNKKKVTTIIIITCIVLLIGGLSVWSYFRNKIPTNPSGTTGNTAGNLYNGGLFCESDGYVYFSNPYDNNSLYRMLPDETDVKQFLATEMSCINADSKYLYCYQGGKGSGTGLGYLFDMSGIYRVQKSDSSNSTCLVKDDVEYVLLSDNDLYYTTVNGNKGLKKISIDGKDSETLLEADILPVSVQNSTFYYMNNDNSLHLMAYDTNTKNAHQVLADDIYMPIIEGNVVYGIDVHNNYALISIDVSDGTKTTLDTDRTDMLNLADNYIYYQTSGDNPQLKRVRRDGSDMSVVMDGVYSNINITSYYVYFTAYNTTTPVYHTPAYGAINVTTFQAAADAAKNSSN